MTKSFNVNTIDVQTIWMNFKLSNQTCDVSQSFHIVGCTLCKTMNDHGINNQMVLKALEYYLNASIKTGIKNIKTYNT